MGISVSMLTSGLWRWTLRQLSKLALPRLFGALLRRGLASMSIPGSSVIKPYLYIGVFLAVLAFVWWYSDRQYDAGYNAARAEYLDDLQKTLDKNKALQVQIDALTADLLALEDARQTQYAVIREEVPVYVQDNRDCDMSRGAVWLLNRAAMPDAEHPALSEAAKQAPSTVTQRAATEHCIGWAEQYNDLAERHDALIRVLKESGL